MLLLMTGPSRGGTLNDANIVRQSRIVNRAYEGRGTGRGGPPEPNMRTNAWSLIRQRPTLAPDEAANFVVPLVIDDAGRFLTVALKVSTVFAVKYVPPYSIQIRANGLEKMRVWGCRASVMSESLNDSLRVACPEAFCMIALRLTLVGYYI